MGVEFHNRITEMRESMQVVATMKSTGKLFDWLPAPDPAVNLASARDRRQKDTGNWLLQSPAFLDWKATANSLMWLHGKPGSGKTILSSTAIYSLFELRAKNFIVLYFYFDFQTREKQLLPGFLKSVIVQLLNQVDVTTGIVQRSYVANAQGSTVPPLEELMWIVQQMIEISPPVYLCIDALDECQEWETLLDFLMDLRGRKQDHLHIFTTSRKERDIEDTLRPAATHTVSLEESVVHNDILAYVEHRLQTDRKLSKWPEKTKDEIKESLINGANGMFQWVECQLDAIRGCLKPGQLRRKLTSLPKTLDETYARILNNIDEDYVEDVQRVLCCLIYSYYPVAVEELANIVAIVAEGEEYYDDENCLREPRDILTLCSGLVTTARSRRTTLMGDAQIPIEEVRIAHFSVKEYLVSERMVTEKTTKFFIEERLAHEMLANLAIHYLLHCHETHMCDSLDFITKYEKTSLEMAAFAPYAACFWSCHLRAAQLDESSALYQDCFKIFTDPALLKDLVKLRRGWFQYDEVMIMWRCGYVQIWNGNHQYLPDFEPIPPLFLASVLGLDPLVFMLLDAKEDPNSSTSEGSCLAAAVFGGYHLVVDKLLDAGADVNHVVLQSSEENKIRLSKTAIYEAASSGNEQLARRLLAAGADVNLERWPSGQADGHGVMHDRNTPLQVAVRKGHKGIVKLLLDAGARPDATTGDYWNILEDVHGDPDITMLLHDAGVDVTSTSRSRHVPMLATRPSPATSSQSNTATNVVQS